MIIEQPAQWLRWLYPRALWRMDRKERAVYLTFDDGPIPESTPFILSTLDEYGARATFFMVGDNVRKYPELYDSIVAAGHQVGNHTFHHQCCQRTYKSPVLQTAARVHELCAISVAQT